MVKDIIDEIEKDLLDGATNGFDAYEEEEEILEVDDGDIIGHAFIRGARMAK